jgi:hypothetical protein
VTGQAMAATHSSPSSSWESDMDADNSGGRRGARAHPRASRDDDERFRTYSAALENMPKDTLETPKCKERGKMMS